MNLKFKNIKLHNFMSYQDAEVSLDRHGYVLVSGVNNNPIDNAKSNGTGKSSLFSAISWVLTGLTVSGSKEVANIYLDGTTSVELDFTVDETGYKTVRTKNPSNLKLFVNGEDKSGKGIRDTEKILSEYLPDLTHTLLNSVIILGQGLPQKFTNNTPSGRKEVLEKLSNSDFMIADLKSRVADRHTQLTDDLRKTELELVETSTRKDVLDTQIEHAKSDLAEYTDEYHQELQQNKQDLLQTSDELLNTISQLDIDINNLSTQISQHSAELSAKALEYESGKAQLPVKDTSEITKHIADLQIQIGTLAKEISKLDNITDVCPTCGQKIPNVVKIDTTDKKAELQTLNEQLKQSQDQYQDIVNYNSQILGDYQVAYNDNIKDTNKLIQQLTTQLDEQKTKKQKLNNQLQQIGLDIQQVEFKLADFLTDKERLQKSIDTYTEQSGGLQNKILYYNEYIKDIRAHLDVNSKMTTILTRDFRGYLISNVIDYIAKQSKQYAKEIFGTDNLDFELDGNNINIKYDSKDYDVLSGGEKQKVDVIIQFAIRDMLCAYLNFSSNILVLDEITDSLDIVGSQKMFNLIAHKLNDVEAVFIISHHQDDFGIPYDDQINILKGNDKISRIST